jgi:hypothetical protein
MAARGPRGFLKGHEDLKSSGTLFGQTAGGGDNLRRWLTKKREPARKPMGITFLNKPLEEEV